MAEESPGGGGLKIGNRTIPTWAIVGGGLALVLLVLVGRGNQGSAGTLDRSGVAAEEQAQQYAAFREESETRLTAFQERLTGQQEQFSDRIAATLEQSQARLEAALSQQAGQTETALAAQAAASEQQVSGLQAVLDRLSAAIASLTTPAPAPAPPPASGTPTVPGLPAVTVSDEEVNAWAAGIGLPASWGFNFVNRFGRLPANIPELEDWRRAIGYRTDDGRWCIGLACI